MENIAQNTPAETQFAASAPATVEYIDGVGLVPFEMKFKAPMQKAIAAALKEGKEAPTQRPAFEIRIPQYTLGKLQELMAQDEKVAAFVLSLANEAIQVEARAQVMDDEKPVNSDAELDKSKLDLVYIANLSAADRASRVEITKEALAAFYDVFVKYASSFIPNITATHAAILGSAFKKRFVDWKTQTKALTQLRGLLILFAQSVPEEVAQEQQPVLDYLVNLADKYLNKPQIDDVAALLNSIGSDN